MRWTKEQKEWGAITLAYMLIVLTSSLMPDYNPGGSSKMKEYIFNAGHVPIYIILTFLLASLFKVFGAKRLPIIPIVIWGAGFGILNEFVQSFVPGRSVSLSDEGLNILGITIMLAALRTGYIEPVHGIEARKKHN